MDGIWGSSRKGIRYSQRFEFAFARDFALSLLARKREGVAMVHGVLDGSLTTLFSSKAKGVDGFSNFWRRLI